MDLTSRPPMSKKQIKRLGEAICDGDVFDGDLYIEFVIWLDQVLTVAMDEVAEALGWDGGPCFLTDSGPPEVDRVIIFMSGRVKMLETIREKLKRMPTYPLASIQDLVGVRVEGSFSLTQQQLAAERIAGHFRQIGASKVEIHRIIEDHHQGYRAVHVHANFPSARIEVQVRTELQSAWANTYEVAGDLYGRHIRYEGSQPGEVDVVTALHQISTSAYEIDRELANVNRECSRVQGILDQELPRETKQEISRSFHHILKSRNSVLHSAKQVTAALDGLREHFIGEGARRMLDTDPIEEV